MLILPAEADEAGRHRGRPDHQGRRRPRVERSGTRPVGPAAVRLRDRQARGVLRGVRSRGEPDDPAELERALNLADEVIRYKVLLLPAEAGWLLPPPRDDRGADLREVTLGCRATPDHDRRQHHRRPGAAVHGERGGGGQLPVASNTRSGPGRQVEGRRHVVLHGQRLAALAENVAESLTRGTRVVVPGACKQRSWETQDGEKRTVIEIEADEVGPSLRWATAKVEKTSRVRPAARVLGRLGREGRCAGRRRHERGDTTGCRVEATRTAGAPGVPARRRTRRPGRRSGKRKFCIFCKDRTVYIDYKDTVTLRKFVSERGKIRARRVTGNCVQHQRDVASAVKNAREMALLPYSSR